METKNKSCETCAFNMPNNKGEFVCAGRNDNYGNKTPITNIDYNTCWKESYASFCDRNNN